MIVSPAEELSAFFFCLLSGIGTGLLFDLFRLFRRKKHRGTARMAVEDTLFFLLSAALIFFVLFKKNDGEVRFFEWVAILLGIMLYAWFFSPVVFRVLVFLKEMLHKAGRFLLRIMLFPLLLACRILKRPFFAVVSPIRLWGKKIKAHVKNGLRNRQKKRKIAKKVWKKV